VVSDHSLADSGTARHLAHRGTGKAQLRDRVNRAIHELIAALELSDQIPEDRTIRRAADADYRYIGIDTTGLDVGGTVQRIKGAIPEVYAG
jgi:hypothetical protein